MPTRDFGDGGPPLTIEFVLFVSVSFTLAYVLPFYFSPTTRPSPTLSRDSPAVIRTRVRLVGTCCAICAHTTTLILRHYCSHTFSSALRQMGLFPPPILGTLLPLVLTAILFLGPLFERGIVLGGLTTWLRGKELLRTLESWPGYRNFIAGPATEELLFRGTLVPLFLHSPLSTTQVVLLAPLPFGLAHVHHAYEFRLTHPTAPMVLVIAQSLFQFVYTTLFGWFAALVLVRTGSLWACVLCHAFANWMGLPRVWGRVGRKGDWVLVEEGGDGSAGSTGKVDEAVLTGGVEGEKVEERKERKEREEGKKGKWVKSEDQRAGIVWTVAYYALLVTGVVGFWKGLWVLTESESALATV
ncbi:MAG: hypothetical protein MMC23_009669 [Stictis urceolatum]|nr:hypothetical protein [Stictis urceolata]